MEDAEAVPSTPLGPLAPQADASAAAADGAALAAAVAATAGADEGAAEEALALMPPQKLAGLQSLIGRLLGARGGAK